MPPLPIAPMMRYRCARTVPGSQRLGSAELEEARLKAGEAAAAIAIVPASEEAGRVAPQLEQKRCARVTSAAQRGQAGMGGSLSYASGPIGYVVLSVFIRASMTFSRV